MNIAKIMIPRACTVFLNEKQTVRQGWEVMTRNGYTAIPVLNAEQHYIGTVSEGDFLRYVLNTGSLDKMDIFYCIFQIFFFRRRFSFGNINIFHNHSASASCFFLISFNSIRMKYSPFIFLSRV